MADYFMLFSPGLIGATLGSLARSIQRGHNTKTLMMRILESAVIGYPAHYVVVNFFPIEAGSPVHVAAVGGLVYLFYSNAMTRNLVENADSYGNSLLGQFFTTA